MPVLNDWSFSSLLKKTSPTPLLAL